MSSYSLLVVLMSLAALFAYINHRYIKLPFVIGLFLLSTVLSIVVVSSKVWNIENYESIRIIVENTNISELILEMMLGFLLFAGSLHTNWLDIKKQVRPISLFAVLGVISSTILIAFMLLGISYYLGLPLQFIHCLIFGALISPTDPIAVLGILKKANVSNKIESTIVGESLFNDGIGVVIFIALLETLQLGDNEINFGHFGTLFIQEAIGGLLFGLILGFCLHKLLKSINNYETEVLLTIAFVMAGYAICIYWHISGALAMVIMGLMVGNYKIDLAMSDITQEYVHKFWELVDVILNAILFITIGFVLVVIDFKFTYIVLGLISVIIVLFSRVIVVYLPNLLFSKLVNITHKEAKIIVWGGLRGGLSIALVLSLPDSEAKQILIIATYFCVVFSILIQGLTIEKLAKLNK